MQFIKDKSYLYLFYRTIEIRLNALFHSVLAAQGGYLQASKGMKFTIGATAPDLLSGVWSFANLFTDALLTCK